MTEPTESTNTGLTGSDAQQASTIASAGVADQRAKEAYFTASQRQLIWARFKKQRAAMVAAVVLMVLVVAGIFDSPPLAESGLIWDEDNWDEDEWQ